MDILEEIWSYVAIFVNFCSAFAIKMHFNSQIDQIPGDNFESIHFFICFETAIPEQYMKLELVPKTFQGHLLQH